MKLEHLTESDELKDLMLKIRKSSYGGFNAKKLEQVLTALEWGCIKRVSSIIQKRLPSALERELDPKNSVRFDGVYKDVPESQFYITCSKYYNGEEKKEASKAAIEAIHTELKKIEVPEPTESPKKNKRFIWDVSTIQHHDWPAGGSEFSFKFRVSLSVEVLAIKAPNGKEFNFGKVDGNSDNLSHFVNWAKDTSLHQEVLDYLGMESVESTKKAERTRENTGTCGVCCHEQKLKNGKLVLHGYQRPGHGYIIGDCFGVGYEPWEKSKLSAVEYIKALGKLLKQREGQLKKLENGDVKSLPAKDRQGKPITLTPSDKGWEHALGIMIANMKNEIRYIGQDITMYEGRVEKWEEQDLPWERIQKRQGSNKSVK